MNKILPYVLITWGIIAIAVCVWLLRSPHRGFIDVINMGTGIVFVLTGISMLRSRRINKLERKDKRNERNQIR